MLMVVFFESILNEKDAIISDSLNHASIIDFKITSKANRFRYSNSNMDELEKYLIETQNYRNSINYKMSFFNGWLYRKIR